MVPDELSGGPRFAAFAEHYLRHTKGRWAGQPVTLEPWQREWAWEALEVDPGSGLRLYQEVGLGLPRKNGKSTVASGFGLYGLVADGENEPEVYVGAAARQQAGIVLSQSLRMAKRSHRLMPYVRVTKYAIEGIRNGGIMRALSSDGALQHGLNPSMSLVDEVHAHKTADLWTALTTGTGAREQPLTLWITTAGVDEENLLRDLYGQMFDGPGELTREGPFLLVYRDRANGVLVHWYGATRDDDPEDPRVWKGCNPASWRTEDALRRDFNRLRSKGRMLEWRIYHLNMIMGTEEAWLPDGAWAKIAEPRPAGILDPWHGLDPSRAIVVGIDKAHQSEAAAIVAAQRREDGRLLVRARHFGAESLTGRVSSAAIRDALRELRQRFPEPAVRDPKTKRLLPGPAFGFDPYGFREMAEALEEEGLNMVTFAQTASTMGPASTATYERVATGGLVHDGDPVLGKHVADSTAVMTERGMKVVKDKRRPNSGCIALVMAVGLSAAEPPQRFVRKPSRARGF